jgi:hypothetical protein
MVSAAALLASATALAQTPTPDLPPSAPTGPAPTDTAPAVNPPPALPPMTEPAPTPTPVVPPVVPSTPPPVLTAPEAPPVVPPAPENDEMTPTDPLAGWSGDTMYLRSADNEFQFMPGGRLQIDGYFFARNHDKMPFPSILLRRARLEVAGWVGKWFYYNIGGDFALGAPAGADPVAQNWLATTDDFVGISPWKKQYAVLQVGQYDAPFTQENRTSDKYFDFMERSITVRAFGIPSNKETGGMVYGMLPQKMAYYSVGVFNGDGQNFRNVDAKFDVMGRAWIAPFAMAGVKSMEDVQLGGSFWVGSRGNNGLPLASQSTQGGVTFMAPSWKDTPAMGTATTFELHQRDKLRAFAAELHFPIVHRLGLRAEYVHKKQDLGVENITTAGSNTEAATGLLDGWSVYGEVWGWIVGDDTILPAPGLESVSRLKHFETKAPRHGVMVAARVERLKETITLNDTVASDNVSKGHNVTSFELGANYWYSKRYRASFNYVINWFDGDAKQIDSLKTATVGGKADHEFLFRLGIAL